MLLKVNFVFINMKYPTIMYIPTWENSSDTRVTTSVRAALFSQWTVAVPIAWFYTDAKRSCSVWAFSVMYNCKREKRIRRHLG